MTSFATLIDETIRVLSGYGLVRDRSALLTGDITADATSIAITDATGFEQGVIEIESELVDVVSVDRGSNILTVSSGGRGFMGTTASAHADRTRATMAPVFPRASVAQALNEAIVNTYPTLFGVGSTSFTYSPVQTTYDLPADVDRILSVRAETIGPSKEWATIRRWSFNSVGEDGNQITLEEGGFPGRDILVTYAKIPSTLALGDDWTVTGLRDSAKAAVRYAAASSLVAFMDVSRLSVGTAEADQFDASHNSVGTAAKLSAQLYQRYLVELDQERRRLRSATPAVINVRTR